MNKKSIVTAALLFAYTSAIAAPWTIDKSQDEITDELSFFVSTPGSTVECNSVLNYKPYLVVRVRPKTDPQTKATRYKADMMISIDVDAFRRDQTEIITRFDKQPPTTEVWPTSTTRTGVFAPDWETIFPKLRSATNMTVRYKTTLGYLRTTTFNLTGLTNALHDVKRRSTNVGDHVGE